MQCNSVCPLCANSGHGPLFDHLIGACEHGRRHGEAEGLRNFEIDHELVLGWRLHGKIGGLLAFEDAIDVNRGAPMLVDKINTIGDQNAAGSKCCLDQPCSSYSWPAS